MLSISSNGGSRRILLLFIRFLSFMYFFTAVLFYRSACFCFYFFLCSFLRFHSFPLSVLLLFLSPFLPPLFLPLFIPCSFILSLFTSFSPFLPWWHRTSQQDLISVSCTRIPPTWGRYKSRGSGRHISLVTNGWRRWEDVEPFTAAAVLTAAALRCWRSRRRLRQGRTPVDNVSVNYVSKALKDLLKKNTVCFLSRRRVLTHAPMTVSSGDNNNNKTKLILFICSILREIETQLNKEKTHLLSAHVLTKLSSSHSVSPKVD